MKDEPLNDNKNKKKKSQIIKPIDQVFVSPSKEHRAKGWTRYSNSVDKFELKKLPLILMQRFKTRKNRDYPIINGNAAFPTLGWKRVLQNKLKQRFVT